MEDTPNFKSWDDLQKFYDKATSGKSKDSPTGKRKRSRRTKPAQPDPSQKIQHEETVTPTYKTIHLYIRPGDTWEQILKDAREETNFAGPGTMVFAHNHKFGEPETDSCREVRSK